ncbi:hypothetical protein [Chromobacterium haemolyticum]|uniref:hypothetical protein n=1 Tax=Chromobacterium haemolyticum TaxID=394935 RepID=UPI0009DA7261|nr:hypothetical protein [Chromobacterium haemolyticum]OQS41165.1 hypothetical protein B0T39_09405 [Chromobacterium haemolyticum]
MQHQIDTAMDLQRVLDAADDYARAAAKAHVESLYGTSKSYTAECFRDENEARSKLHDLLAAGSTKPAGEPVAWRYIRRANGEVILDSIELNPWMPELLEDIRQHYDVEEIPLYATPQPATSAEWTAPVLSLIALAQAVSIALDDSEERQGDEGRVHLIDSDNFDEVCNALEALESLPDDKPGHTLGPAGKAEWALRVFLKREEKQHD